MLEARLLARLQDKKARLDALRPLPEAAVARLHQQLMVEWTFHSNAIEGNTLSLRETQFVVEMGLTIGGKSVREHLEVTNHQEAIRLVEALAARDVVLTAFDVRTVHRVVLACIDEGEAGQYRSLPVRSEGTEHAFPDAWQIPALMSDWEGWLAGPARDLHPVERAALAHHRLVAIHPFIDGNGRTARLIMNLLLIRDGYPPTVIRRENRRQYYQVLAQADRGHPQPLVALTGRAVERSLVLYLEACTPRSEPPPSDELWISLRDAARGTPYSQEYLGLLARNGRLEAVKRGRNWVTTRQAVAAYRASVHPQIDEHEQDAPHPDR